jgi:tRNA-specific 2-thiouridylase
VSSDILARTIFPVGELHKSEVRAHAQQFKLPVAAKSDSQGLCFVGDVSMRDFLRRYISVEAGPVLDAQGAVIGTHEGAALYTKGQRHGFEVHTAEETRPYYVIATQVADNTITVSPNRADAECRKAFARNVHWISGSRPDYSDMQAQFRYRDTPVPVRLSEFAEGVEINFTEPRIASPGQSVVFYHGDVCLGGGIITRP